MAHRIDQVPEGYEPMPSRVEPMLATAGQLPGADEGWAYEFKWDGIRAVAFVEGGRVKLVSRHGNELTASFPELWALGEQLGSRRAVLDGEVVVFGDDGRPSFQLLQPRAHAEAAKAKRLAQARPVTFVLFDLLYLDGESLLDRPYEERRRRLEALGLGQGAAWALSPRFAGPGIDVLRASQEQGLEGVLAKRTTAPYRPGRRSPEWTKVKNVAMQEVVVGGWTTGQGRRGGRLGSLLVGVPQGTGLRYVGQVGTGFTDSSLADLATRLAPLERGSSPFANQVPTRYRQGAHWAEPRLVGEVAFGEWTQDGRLRHPSWRGLRHDKTPDEVVIEP